MNNLIRSLSETPFAAIFQLLLAFLQAGKLSWLFSDIAMSGFMTGAGVAIFTSQLKTLFGLEKEAQQPSHDYTKVYYVS